jgi:molybdate transport system substrate-binding protein
MSHKISGLLLAVLALWLTGCAGRPAPTIAQADAASLGRRPTLTIFAAASLTEAFTEAAGVFEQRHSKSEVLLNFAGSNTLRLQIEQGARADIFASANSDHADALFAARLIETPVVFAHNRLVIITPVGNPGGVVTPADLGRPGLKLVLAGPSVPAGQYARQSLQKLSGAQFFGADFMAQVERNLVSEEDTVKGVVAKVQLGEADAGIVYQSDVTLAVAALLNTIAIPAQGNVTTNYPLAVAADAAQPTLARQFIEFVLSPEGQAIMARHGFEPARP